MSAEAREGTMSYNPDEIRRLYAEIDILRETLRATDADYVALQQRHAPLRAAVLRVTQAHTAYRAAVDRDGHDCAATDMALCALDTTLDALARAAGPG